MKTRSEEMIEMRKSMTLQEIGDHFGVSRERVRQIVGNTGYEVQKRRISERERFILEHPELTTKQLAESIGCGQNLVSSIRADIRHAIEPGALAKGTAVEDTVSALLHQHGIANELMPHFHAYDILLSNGKTIDVKSAHSIMNPPSSIGYPYYHFPVRKADYCDYFIFVVVPEEQYYVVPAWDVKPENRITTGTRKTPKWRKYLERWDLLK